MNERSRQTSSHFPLYLMILSLNIMEVLSKGCENQSAVRIINLLADCWNPPWLCWQPSSIHTRPSHPYRSGRSTIRFPATDSKVLLRHAKVQFHSLTGRMTDVWVWEVYGNRFKEIMVIVREIMRRGLVGKTKRENICFTFLLCCY